MPCYAASSPSSAPIGGASAILSSDVPVADPDVRTITAVLGTLPAGTTADTKFATVLIVIVLTTISAGVFFLLLGYFKLAGWCVSCLIR